MAITGDQKSLLFEQADTEENFIFYNLSIKQAMKLPNHHSCIYSKEYVLEVKQVIDNILQGHFPKTHTEKNYKAIISTMYSKYSTAEWAIFLIIVIFDKISRLILNYTALKW